MDNKIEKRTRQGLLDYYDENRFRFKLLKPNYIFGHSFLGSYPFSVLRNSDPLTRVLFELSHTYYYPFSVNPLLGPTVLYSVNQTLLRTSPRIFGHSFLPLGRKRRRTKQSRHLGGTRLQGTHPLTLRYFPFTQSVLPFTLIPYSILKPVHLLIRSYPNGQNLRTYLLPFPERLPFTVIQYQWITGSY